MTRHIAKRLLATAGIALVLSACSTPEERAARAQAQLDADKAECVELGFTPDTEALSNCILQLRQIRADEQIAREQRRANNNFLFSGGFYRRGFRYGYW